MPPRGGPTACRGSPQRASGLGRPVNRKRVARQVASAGLQGLTRCKGSRPDNQAPSVYSTGELICQPVAPGAPSPFGERSIIVEP